MTRDIMWRWYAWARGEWTDVDVLCDMNAWANRIYGATRRT